MIVHSINIKFNITISSEGSAVLKNELNKVSRGCMQDFINGVNMNATKSCDLFVFL